MGSFVNRVRKGKVASPTTPRWTAASWQHAFDATLPHDEQDQALFRAGNWFAQMFTYYRSLVPELGTFGLKQEEMLRAAIAGVNRNWIIVDEQMRPTGEPGDVILSEHLLSRRIIVTPWNFEVDTNGLVEAMVDSTRHIVASTAPTTGSRANVGEIMGALFNRSVVSSAYLALEGLWREFLWNAWAIFETTESYILRPTELRHALAEAAATFRGQTLGVSGHIGIERAWKSLPADIRTTSSEYRVVRETRGTGRNREIVTRKQRDDEVPGAFRLQLIGTGAWLDHLSRSQLPRLPDLTPVLLFQAWHYLATLAEASWKRMPKETEVRGLAQLWSYAPSFESTALTRSVASALSVSQSVARSLLGVLTMSTLKDADPWLTPLWKLSGMYYIMIPVALTSNPRRLFEHWLTIGGIDLSIRGPLFEAYVRQECISGIESSPILSKVAHCASDGIELDPSIGDMDLVCVVGDVVLVGEIKCTAVPSSAVDRSNYYGILHEAAEQVIRRIVHTKSNAHALAKKIGCSLTSPKFIGVIITDQEIGVGHLIDGIPVVDHVILAKYFRDPKLEHGVSFAKDGTKEVMETTKFYRTPGEAESNLEGYLLSPPQLRTALRFVGATESPLLTPPGGKRAVYRDVAVTVPPMLGAPDSKSVFGVSK